MFGYDVESVLQAGTVDGNDHFAYFQHVSIGYTFMLPWSPRLMAMFDYASGTQIPAGTYNQTFDGLYGARRSEFTPTDLLEIHRLKILIISSFNRRSGSDALTPYESTQCYDAASAVGNSGSVGGSGSRTWVFMDK